MSILNRNNHDFYAVHQGVLYHEERGLNQFVSNFVSKQGELYYYLELKDAEVFDHKSIKDIVPSRILRRIRDKSSNIHLMVHNSHEAFLSVIDALYRHIILGAAIPPEKILYVNNAFNMVEEVDRVSRVYNNKGHIKCALFLDFEQSAVTYLDYAKNNNIPLPDTSPKEYYKKSFLNLNRRWRFHRPAFTALLCAKGLLPRGHVSLGHADCGEFWSEPLFTDTVKYFEDNQNGAALLKAHKEEIISLPPLYLDTEDLITNRAQNEASINPFYEETFFSIVSETHGPTKLQGYEHGVFLSEKSFKVLLNKHPFIMVSLPGTVAAFKKIGYQTFDGLIDESYDSIEKDTDRWMAVLSEVDRLCKLSKSGREKFINEAYEICQYNFNKLAAKKSFFYRLN